MIAPFFEFKKTDPEKDAKFFLKVEDEFGSLGATWMTLTWPLRMKLKNIGN
jgi:hypothetical protein